MHNNEYEDLRLVAEKVNQQLQENLSSLAEKWQIRSKAKWVESGEKSTKYFFMRYKTRLSSTPTSKIKDPSNPLNEDPVTILQYIKNNFEQLYKTEEIDTEAVEKLTQDLP